jgi:hypothetical protein
MRQVVGAKKKRKLEQELGFPIYRILVRGNTGHRKDLVLHDGFVLHYWPDKSLTACTDIACWYQIKK